MINISKKILLSLLLVCVAAGAWATDYTIRLKRKSGVYAVACVVNGVKKDFIFDTGAAKTSLSQEFVNELLAKRKITSADFRGTTQTRNASGVVDNNTVIVLARLQVGNLVLSNVEAIVATSQKAPLLLGLNAIEMLGRWSIRNGFLILHDDLQYGEEDTYYIEEIDDEPSVPAPVVTGNVPLAEYRLDAYKGDADAQYRLGVCYRDGTGVDRNEEIAFKWFTLAAGQGHRDAQAALAECYRNGMGTRRDAALAEYWEQQAVTPPF